MSLKFVCEPLENPSNSLEDLLEEMLEQQIQAGSSRLAAFAIDNVEQKEAHRAQAIGVENATERVKTEILRRFAELEQRTQGVEQKLRESETNARRRIGQQFDGPVDGQDGEAD